MDDLLRLAGDRLQQDHPLLLRGGTPEIARRALGYMRELGMPAGARWRYVEYWRASGPGMLYLQIDPHVTDNVLTTPARIGRTSNTFKGWPNTLGTYVLALFGRVVPYAGPRAPWPGEHLLFSGQAGPEDDSELQLWMQRVIPPPGLNGWCEARWSPEKGERYATYWTDPEAKDEHIAGIARGRALFRTKDPRGRKELSAAEVLETERQYLDIKRKHPSLSDARIALHHLSMDVSTLRRHLQRAAELRDQA